MVFEIDSTLFSLSVALLCFFPKAKLLLQVTDLGNMSPLLLQQADLETDEVYAQMTLIPVPPIVSI